MSKPSIRPIDRTNWAPGILITEDEIKSLYDIANPGVGSDGLAVTLADATIATMLTGKIPRSAGANTRIASFGLCQAYAQRETGPVFVRVNGLTHKIEPFKHGLAEVRAARAKGKRA